MKSKYIELKEKLSENINPLEKKYFELAKKFSLKEDQTNINSNLINQYEKIKDGVTFGTLIKKENNKYNVSMIIFDVDFTYSNIIPKVYDSLDDANRYFYSLKELISNNDLNKLSSILLEKMSTHN